MKTQPRPPAQRLKICFEGGQNPFPVTIETIMSDYEQFFSRGTVTADLADEVQARRESAQWDAQRRTPLKKCPCCGADAHVNESPGFTQIACSHNLCKLVSAKTLANAVEEWNKPRFSQGKP